MVCSVIASDVYWARAIVLWVSNWLLLIVELIKAPTPATMISANAVGRDPRNLDQSELPPRAFLPLRPVSCS
ncbi:hypothetical protein IH824_17725 [candidate division KSB1 bacterium]|nr:hypothetical protein [candidate division KSB1 bacterium]